MCGLFLTLLFCIISNIIFSIIFNVELVTFFLFYPNRCRDEASSKLKPRERFVTEFDLSKTTVVLVSSLLLFYHVTVLLSLIEKLEVIYSTYSTCAFSKMVRLCTCQALDCEFERLSTERLNDFFLQFKKLYAVFS